jgi:hypothetical protein
MASPCESTEVGYEIEIEIEIERNRKVVQKYVTSISNKWNLYKVITCSSEQAQLHSLLESERKRLKTYISYTTGLHTVCCSLFDKNNKMNKQ